MDQSEDQSTGEQDEVQPASEEQLTDDGRDEAGPSTSAKKMKK